jgi:hypothetical protein
LKGKETDEYTETDTSYITKSKLQKYYNVSKADFFASYDKLFKTLDKEEEDEEEVGTEHPDVPRFGDSESTKEEVYAFYKYWESFATSK